MAGFNTTKGGKPSGPVGGPTWAESLRKASGPSIRPEGVGEHSFRREFIPDSPPEPPPLIEPRRSTTESKSARAPAVNPATNFEELRAVFERVKKRQDTGLKPRELDMLRRYFNGKSHDDGLNRLSSSYILKDPRATLAGLIGKLIQAKAALGDDLELPAAAGE